jgi:translation initiation factor 1 (eIF-1/SUI1)
LLRKSLCAGAAVKTREEDGTRFIEVQGSCQAETAKILKGMGWCDSVRRRG